MKNFLIITCLVLLAIGTIFRTCCGIFVIQPIGAVPDGITIVYWRNGVNLPFISSADGFLIDNGQDISLMARGMTLSKFLPIVTDREIRRFKYSNRMYLKSTGGEEFDR